MYRADAFAQDKALLCSKPSRVSPSELQKADDLEVAETTHRTRECLERLIQKRVKAAPPAAKAQGEAASRFFALSDESTGRVRAVRVQERQADPLDPSRFKARKLARPPPEPQAPVLRSPPRRLTAAEQAAWRVPPSISNWKNPKGFTIPLDKRSACDGRLLKEHTAGDRFAAFAESLGEAEAAAREELERRSAFSRKQAEREKAEKERYLRELAEKARLEHSAERLQGHGADSQADTTEARRGLAAERAIVFSRSSDASSEFLFDSQLLGRNAGMSSGFQDDDDDYNVYTRPLFAGKRSAPENAEEPHQHPRSVPVQFERGAVAEASTSDPFGLDGFLTEAKRGRGTHSKSTR